MWKQRDDGETGTDYRRSRGRCLPLQGIVRMKIPAVIPPFADGFEQIVAVAAPPLPYSAKSPLRYPGGKTKAVETIRAYIPKGTKKLAAPFLGGGSLELTCAADSIKVYGLESTAKTKKTGFTRLF